jgi:hypothetical protein
VLKKVVEWKQVMFEHSRCFLPNTTKGTVPLDTYNFETKADQLLSITVPFSKTLMCLEADNANSQDVFLFLHAAFHFVEEALKAQDTEFPVNVQNDVLNILDY